MKYAHILGWCHHSDLKFVDENTSKNLTIYSEPTLNAHTVGSAQWYNSLSNAARVDVAIFTGFGVDFQRHILPIFSDSTAKQIFDSIPVKVYWSLDTHWQWDTEAYYANKFDFFYTAQAQYMPLVPCATYMPPAHYLTSYDELQAITATPSTNVADSSPRDPRNPLLTPPEKNVDFIIPAYDKPYGDKRALIKLIEAKIKALGFTYNTQPISDRLSYCAAIANAKVLVNVPSLGNTNFKPLEAWAVNTTVLTPRSTAFNQFTDFRKAVVHYNRDLSDFQQCAEKALSFDKPHTRKFIVAKHMIMHRYIDIINAALNMQYKITYPA